MARGDKNYDKVVRKNKNNKGGKSSARKKAVHKMVEAIIQGDTDTAEEELKGYLQVASRDILLGEMNDSEMNDDDAEMDDDDSEMDDESECECDDDCDEGEDCKCKSKEEDDDYGDDKKTAVTENFNQAFTKDSKDPGYFSANDNAKVSPYLNNQAVQEIDVQKDGSVKVTFADSRGEGRTFKSLSAAKAKLTYK